MKRWWTPALALAALTLLADGALATPAFRYGAAFFLLWLAPGLAWGLHLARGRQPGAEDVAVGLGLGFATTALLTLVLSYTPGPFPGWGLVVLINLLVLSPASRAFRSAPAATRSGIRASVPDPAPSVPLALVAVLLLPAATLRLINLGYSEFQGDEGVIVARAAAALLGDTSQLFLHQKGPLEVLLPMATWSLGGTIGEAQARLPFTLAGLVGVTAVLLLGVRLFNRRVGLAGGLLLAVNGYFVAFGRIVQYQGLVLATTGLGLLALWLWAEGKGDRWLLAGGFLLACGLLAHYDAALALPAALYIVGMGARQRFNYKALAVALFLALLALALFYVPFACHANFAKTVAYLRAERMGTDSPVHNNLTTTFALTTLYNSTYYVVFLGLLLVAAGFRSFRRWGVALPLLCLVVLAGATAMGAKTEAGPYAAVAACAVWLAAVVGTRRTSPAERVTWLWFGIPFLFHYFFVGTPRTHVLNAFPAASLLAALPLDGLWERLQRRTVRGALALLLLVLYSIFGYYIWMVFVDHTPEYRRTWPEHRSAFYWTSYEELPLFGLFGFPYRAGWKAVGALMAEQELAGVYASNEEEEVTRWYTRGAERSYCPGPDLYLIAARVQDEMAVDRADLEAHYHLAGTIRVGGEPRLWLYRPEPPPGEPPVYDVEDLEQQFDAGMTPEAVLPRPPEEVIPVGAILGDEVRLASYRLDTADARPGGSLRLTLYWEALAPMQTSYQVFTHLYDGTMWGQHDSTPGCGLWPTTRWEPGRMVRDEHVLPIAPEAPAGAIPLLVGMYDLGSGVRLPLSGSQGDAVTITEVVLP